MEMHLNEKLERGYLRDILRGAIRHIIAKRSKRKRAHRFKSDGLRNTAKGPALLLNIEHHGKQEVGDF